MKRHSVTSAWLCTFCFVSQALHAETWSSCDDFSLEEGRAILHIQSMVQQQGAVDIARKNAIRDELRLMATTNDIPFVADIALDELQRIDGGSASAVAARSSVSLMASAVDRDTKLAALKRISNPGAQKYFATWLSFNERNSNLSTNELFQNRQALIWKSYEKLNNSLRDQGIADQASRLFGALKEWETPYDYEAAMLLIAELHEVHPDNVIPLWTESILACVPDTLPPPFKKEHTLFFMMCVLGKTMGGTEVLATLERLETSGNKYATENVRDALKWVRAGAPYPLKYRELRRAYYSQ